MGIAIVFGFIFVILIVLIFVLRVDSNPNEKEISTPKLPPITSGRSYPWFYIKDCMFYFPVSSKDLGTKEELLEELEAAQKSFNYDKVIELCDQIIGIDYKFSRIWIDKINAIFDNILAGKEWNASVSKNIANCCYNYTRTFSTSYDKSVNTKHLLISTILKRSKEVIEYNLDNASETYSFELYNLLINLYHLMPFSELLDLAMSSLERGKNLEEIQKNSYGTDVIRSLLRYISLTRQKRSIILDRDEVTEVRVAGKTIINDEEYSNSWIGFNILFPEGVSKTELVFKFFDQRRQEIDLSNGSNKRIIELYEYQDLGRCYDLVVLGEDRIKYVTIAVYDEGKKKELNGETANEQVTDEEHKNDEKVEGRQESDSLKTKEEIRNKKIEKAQMRIKAAIDGVDIEDEESDDSVVVEEVKKEESLGRNVEEKLEEEPEEEPEEENIEDSEKLSYKLYPTFAGIKQVAMSENYCLLLREDGKVEKFGNLEKNINVSEWEHIEKLYATNTTAFGIRKNGTITVSGKSMYDNWEYQYVWEHITKLVPSYNHIVGLREDGTVVAVGDNTYGQCKVEEWIDIVDVSASFHTVGLTKEGKVLAIGANNFGECDVDNWTNIEKIATGPFYTVGLRDDGTVVATGLNSCGQCNTNDWKDVKEIYVRGNITAGVRYDGKVHITGRNSYRFEDAKKWQNIKELKLVNDRIIGITNDGRINYIGKPYWGRVKEEWHDISFIEANSNCILGKKEDGSLVCNKPLFGIYMPDNYRNFADIKENLEADKVVVLGKDGKIDIYSINGIDFYKWDTSKFSDVKQIAMSKTHLIGLKSDGTAVVTGDDASLSVEVENWKNLIKVDVGEKFAVGLTIDGRVLAAGNNLYGQCEVNGWLDVVDIAAQGSKTVGVKSTGEVLITGFLEYDEEDFAKEASGIASVAINNKQIMLLDSDGNVSVSYNPTGEDRQEVLEWRNIKKIAAKRDGFIGLKADRTIVSTGDEYIDEWKKIDDISASGSYIVGITKMK